MKFRHLAAAGMLGLALGGVSLASHAAELTIPPPAQTAGAYDGFAAIDWAANGDAVVQDWWTAAETVVEGQTKLITLDFWASAVAINDAEGNKLAGDQLLNPSNGIGIDHEFTIKAQLTELATCNDVVDGQCASASFLLVSGDWEIWYDPNQDANRVLGTGFDNGEKLLEGTLFSGFAGSFTATEDGGTGSNTLKGVVTYTNSDFISPDLIGTTVGTELKFGDDRTVTGALPTGTPFTTPIACNVDNGVICLQADANQSFTVAVPEPASIALLGLGLLGLAAIRRRIV